MAGNLVANPSLEQANGSVPASWVQVEFGPGNATHTYVTGDAHTGSRSARTQYSSTPGGGSGAAWSFATVPASASQTYRYTGWFKSNTTSEVLTVYTLSNGNEAYQVLGLPGPAANWTEFTGTFTTPASTVGVNVYQNISTLGWVEVDDASLVLLDDSEGFDRPLVSITFDDRVGTQWTYARPKLAATGLKATFYLTSGSVELGPFGRMTDAQVQQLVADGHHIGSHSVSHPDLVNDGLSAAQRAAELQNSRTTLQALTGQPVDDFASPYGSYNATVKAEIMARYSSHRTVASGTNGLQTTDFGALKARMVLATTTADDVAAWIAEAQAQNSWLILVIHEIRPDLNPSNPDHLYDTSPTRFDAIMNTVVSSGVAVRTVADARVEVAAQL